MPERPLSERLARRRRQARQRALRRASLECVYCGAYTDGLRVCDVCQEAVLRLQAERRLDPSYRAEEYRSRLTSEFRRKRNAAQRERYATDDAYRITVRSRETLRRCS